MAYAQQINQEQEASYNLSELSLEAQVYLGFKHGTANRDKILKKLTRANPEATKQIFQKSKFICKQGIEISETVLKKLFSGQRVLLNHKYISKITECESTNQNKNILDQLNNLFLIEYHRLTIVDGRPFNYHYSFKLNPKIVDELKEAGLWDLESMPKFLAPSYTNRPNTFSKSNNRSSELTPTSNFSNISISSCSKTKKEPAGVKGAVAPSSHTKTENTQKREDTPRPARVVSNGFLGKGMRLSEMQPYLTEQMCMLLRSKSGRSFTDKAIREITKAVAASKKGSKAIFKHICGFVSYLTLILQNEKRDPNRIGGEGYYTLAGMSEEDKLVKQQEDYLEEVEQMAMRQVCPENQFKGKLAGTLGRKKAYNFLLAMKYTRLEQTTLVIGLNGHVELTERDRSIILAQAQAVFNYTDLQGNSQYVESIEFNMDKAEIYTTSTPPQSQIELPQGIWGKVVKNFIAEYGYDLYTHWLGDKVVVEEDTENQSICLKANSEMVKYRIMERYLQFLSKTCFECGINKIEVN